MELDNATCLAVIAAAEDEASRIGARVSIAIVDAGGNLNAFLRMDGAEIAGPTLAVDKAYTAVANRTSTDELARLAAPGGPLFGLHSNSNGRFVIFGGGVPVVVDDVVTGAIGVSGGTVQEDIACAEAGRQRALELLTELS